MRVRDPRLLIVVSAALLAAAIAFPLGLRWSPPVRPIDTSFRHVDTAPTMASRTKRTYSLKPETLTRVRELAARYGTSQDQLVDMAIERLDRATRDEHESETWASAAEDPDFQGERARIAAAFDDTRWPA